MRIFDRITTGYGERMAFLKGRLELEEAGRKIASHQGELAGMRFFMNELCNVFAIHHIEYNGDTLEEVPELEIHVLKELFQDVKTMETDGRWMEIGARIDRRLDELKTFLFYEAKASRDLDHTHGQRDGLSFYRKICKEIVYEVDRLKEEEPLLQDAYDE